MLNNSRIKKILVVLAVLVGVKIFILNPSRIHLFAEYDVNLPTIEPTESLASQNAKETSRAPGETSNQTTKTAEKKIQVTTTAGEALLTTLLTTTAAPDTTTRSSTAQSNFIKRFPDLLKCNIEEYDRWLNNETQLVVNVNNDLFAKPSSNTTHNLRIVRGILVYFPIESIEHFEYEFRWLYRSWIEMQKSEPAKWRTDIIAFVKKDSDAFKNPDFFLNKLNCKFTNRRQNNVEKPMCILINYIPIRERNIDMNTLKKPKLSMQFRDVNSDMFNYQYLLDQVDILPTEQDKTDKAELTKLMKTSSNTSEYKNLNEKVNAAKLDRENDVNLFYYFVKKKLSTYGYADSILMAFDGYDYFKEGGYNFLIRSDMDVFLTPLFAKWTPVHCNDFIVGGGAYSETLNVKRIKRVSKELDFKYGDIWNLGSTWYSTPEQFRLVSYLTLFGMGYLSEEEFSPVEREGKLGVMMWPYWHYGVLLLYGQNLAMNHLIGSRQLNILKLDRLLDVPSGGLIDINTILHIHVYHGDDMFSKFQFKAGRYDAMMNVTKTENTTLIRYYTLKMALEGKFTDPSTLKLMSQNLMSTKN